jgi:hypothetical protein
MFILCQIQRRKHVRHKNNLKSLSRVEKGSCTWHYIFSSSKGSKKVPFWSFRAQSSKKKLIMNRPIFLVFTSTAWRQIEKVDKNVPSYHFIM